MDKQTVSETQPAYQGRVKYAGAKAKQYQSSRASRDRAELRLVQRAFKLIPPGRVLDAPCGGGRVSVLLAKQGYKMTAADLSEGMLDVAREHLRESGANVLVERQDLEKLAYADRSFDAIICFRVFHHFPNAAIRQRVVRELCRVAGRHIALSYFSPWSVTSAKRKLRVAFGGRPSQKHETSLAEVESYFAAAGFRLVKDFAVLPLVHTLHLAVFERSEA